MELHTGNKSILDADPLLAGFLPLVRADGQKVLDHLTIEEFGIPPFTLMENAGRGAALIIEQNYGPLRGRKVVVYCGSGNNGGDGFVVARILYNRGAHVSVFSLKPPASPEAKNHWLLLQKLQSSDRSDRLHLNAATHDGPRTADLYIDALFGIGINRPLKGVPAGFVERLNATDAPVIALDIPSGLDADLGLPHGTAVRADLTVTFNSHKPGFFVGRGSAYTGHVSVVQIGIPPSLLTHDAVRPVDWISTDEAVSSAIPRRDPQAHKYSAGMVLVIGGSPGLSGAPILSARAAARIGAGYVACAVPKSIQPILAGAMTEIPAIGLSECSDGGINIEAAMHTLQPWLAKASAMVVGPGLGRNPSTQQFVRALLRECSVPVVVDADALVAAAELLKSDSELRNWILTPHTGEFKRMTNSEEISRDRLHLARKWASNWNCTLILKGFPSIIGLTKERAVVCSSGNPALATAGTGDVLSGLCGGLLAQGCSSSTAAVCATHIGGKTADQYAERNHPGTMIAGDMIEGISDALNSLLRET
ncbi:MAG: NAD(P)H-hydrate dehydratase [Rhodothermaceae bacterium]|nr:NAD(P)H-hydrate dehydratase [Rhodothermaceae bacterium]